MCWQTDGFDHLQSLVAWCVLSHIALPHLLIRHFTAFLCFPLCHCFSPGPPPPCWCLPAPSGDGLVALLATGGRSRVRTGCDCSGLRCVARAHVKRVVLGFADVSLRLPSAPCGVVAKVLRLSVAAIAGQLSVWGLACPVCGALLAGTCVLPVSLCVQPSRPYVYRPLDGKGPVLFSNRAPTVARLGDSKKRQCICLSPAPLCDL